MRIKNLTGLIVITLLSVAFTSPKSLSLGLSSSNTLTESEHFNLNEEFLIAQSNEVQDAVNLIHQWRQEGKITVGKSETTTLGGVMVRTGQSDLLPNSPNEIFMMNMETGVGIVVEAVGVNSYKHIATKIMTQTWNEVRMESKPCNIDCLYSGE